MAPDFPSINRQAAGRPMAAAVAPERAQLPSSEAAAAALREGLETWVNELPAENPGRELARNRILTWQRENNGLPPEQTSQLDFYGLGLSSLPHVLSQLQNLTNLDLARNQLTELPPCVCELAGLARLDLALNPLQSLPADIGRLTQLTFLSVRRCGLHELPEAIGDLARLQELNVAGNPALVRLPVSFNGLQSLHTLSADFSGLEAQVIDRSSMPNLRQIMLGMPGAQPAAAQRPRVVALELERARNQADMAQAQQRVQQAIAQAGEGQQEALEILGRVMGAGAMFAAMNDGGVDAAIRFIDGVLQSQPELSQAMRLQMIRQAGQAHAQEEAAAQLRVAARSNAAAQIGGGLVVPTFSQVINDWRARLLAFAERTQSADVRVTLILESSKLLRRMRTDTDFAALCGRLASYHAGSDTGALMALNDMHEAAMAARQEQPDIDERTLIALTSDLFVLGLVKAAALAAAAPARAAGNHVGVQSILLARQSFLCARLEVLGFRARLPTRNVQFNRRNMLPGDGIEMAGELRLLETLWDGTALREHLALSPLLARHVETAFAHEFETMREDIQDRMATLMRRSQLQEGEIDPGPDDAPYTNASDNAENRGPITQGTLMQEIPKLTSELDAKTTALRQRLMAEVVERNLDVLQLEAPARATETAVAPGGSVIA